MFPCNMLRVRASLPCNIAQILYGMPRLAVSFYSLHISSKVRKYYTDGASYRPKTRLACLIPHRVPHGVTKDPSSSSTPLAPTLNGRGERSATSLSRHGEEFKCGRRNPTGGKGADIRFVLPLRRPAGHQPD